MKHRCNTDGVIGHFGLGRKWAEFGSVILIFFSVFDRCFIRG